MTAPKELFVMDKIVDISYFEGFALEAAESILGRNDLDEDITLGYEVSDEFKYWNPVFLMAAN